MESGGQRGEDSRLRRKLGLLICRLTMRCSEPGHRATVPIGVGESEERFEKMTMPNHALQRTGHRALVAIDAAPGRGR